jgi:hypothetical protein
MGECRDRRRRTVARIEVSAGGTFNLAARTSVAARGSSCREIELAFDLRKMAIASIQADTRDLKLTIDSFGQEIRQTGNTIAGFVHHPLDTATEKLLVPAVLSIIKGLRSKKEQA